MMLWSLLLLAKILLCECFVSDYCGHEEITLAVREGVKCKKDVIEEQMETTDLNSVCYLVIHLAHCGVNNVGKCFSKKKLALFSRSSNNITIRGLKSNCSETDSLGDKEREPVFDWLEGFGIETDNGCEVEDIVKMYSDVDGCIEDHLQDIGYKMQAHASNNNTSTRLCNQFSLMLNTCSDTSKIECLSGREKDFLKDLITEKGVWIFSMMVQYFLPSHTEQVSLEECRDRTDKSHSHSHVSTYQWFIPTIILLQTFVRV